MLGIFVSKKEIYDTIVLGISVLENYTSPLPGTDPEGLGGYTQPTWKKTKSTFKCIAKIHALESKPILLKTIVSLFYINALRISDSFADVMSSLYMLLASFLSWINKCIYIYIYLILMKNIDLKRIHFKQIPTPKTCTSISLVNCSCG